MSAPTPPYGAPSLGPIDRTPQPEQPEYGLGWDDYTPHAWRAFSEPAQDNTTKENTPMGDHSINGGYGHQPLPAPPTPAPQQPSGQK